MANSVEYIDQSQSKICEIGNLLIPIEPMSLQAHDLCVNANKGQEKL